MSWFSWGNNRLEGVLEVRNQAAVAHNFLQEVWHGNAGDRAAIGQLERGGSEIDAHALSVFQQFGAVANQHWQAQVDGIAIEQSGEGRGDDRRNAKVFERLWCLLARRANAKIPARHHYVAGAHPGSEVRD